ncbi:signal recognition particle, SRP9/SRP14 subunit [Entophlyctis helioformis]|nr:signal recognition particle, SRP9/SRP14 subunit [Entophlyctis helioformis]
MVNFTLWDDYQAAVNEMYTQSPFNTRYVSKYRHCDGRLVLKVTNGPKCLKFKTDKLQDLNKFDRLNRGLMALMQQNPIDLAKVDAEKQEQLLQQQQQAASGAGASGSGGKKKGRKGK